MGRRASGCGCGLQRFVAAQVCGALTPLVRPTAAADAEGVLRGPLHRLAEGLGVVAGATER